jgi:hypothetical protein
MVADPLQNILSHGPQVALLLSAHGARLAFLLLCHILKHLSFLQAQSILFLHARHPHDVRGDEGKP